MEVRNFHFGCGGGVSRRARRKRRDPAGAEQSIPGIIYFLSPTPVIINISQIDACHFIKSNKKSVRAALNCLIKHLTRKRNLMEYHLGQLAVYRLPHN